MARAIARPAERGVGVSLIHSFETDAIARHLRRTQPHVTLTDRGVYLKADAADEITIDLAALSADLGRPIDIETVLISIASYFGEIEPQRGAAPGTGRLILRADAPPEETADQKAIS
ncbi:MmoB/DmpM family protein [Mycolicibacterium helvum]|uniref:Monooxygenase n=1 Tax=Mycolicibacterium helvum TaxID=1534349 RepID=A0A7I7T545_9MYCO|nr:MmoB/DmpM family protein [Mycolicibacterium helvum]BBY63631.1 hypothetical protein MHEL_18740 [Mycolicibacterium helvum]